MQCGLELRSVHRRTWRKLALPGLLRGCHLYSGEQVAGPSSRRTWQLRAGGAAVRDGDRCQQEVDREVPREALIRSGSCPRRPCRAKSWSMRKPESTSLIGERKRTPAKPRRIERAAARTRRSPFLKCRPRSWRGSSSAVAGSRGTEDADRGERGTNRPDLGPHSPAAVAGGGRSNHRDTQRRTSIRQRPRNHQPEVLLAAEAGGGRLGGLGMVAGSWLADHCSMTLKAPSNM